MALPPWTVDLLRRGVQDLARQVSDPETGQALRNQALKLVDELPQMARDQVDNLLRQAESAGSAVRERWPVPSSPQHRPTLGRPQRINASGQLAGSKGSDITLPESVVDVGHTWLHSANALTPAERQGLSETIAESLSEICGISLHAHVTTSMTSALSLVAHLGKDTRPVWVPRCCATPLEIQDLPVDDASSSSQIVLADALRWLGGHVREFGDIAGPSEADWHALGRGTLQPGLATADRVQSNNLVVRLDRTTCDSESSIRHDEPQSHVVVLPRARWSPARPEISDGVSVASKIIERGADAVVIRGGVFTGTPDCGILLARPELFEQLRSSPNWMLVAAPAVTMAMVAEAVRVHAESTLPIDELLLGSEENLRDRAERLATQCSGIESIGSVRVSADPASLGSTSIGSRQVRLRCESVPAATLVDRLAGSNPALIAGLDGDELILDMRFVQPNQQADIAEILSDSLGNGKA
ncbi:MAG: hypothetical protein AAF670_12700 [Planctomycetota bacterium]